MKSVENVPLSPEYAIHVMRQTATDMRTMIEVITRSEDYIPQREILLYAFRDQADRIGSIAGAMENLLDDAVRQGRYQPYREAMRDQQKASRARYDLLVNSIPGLGSVLPDDQN